MKIPYFVFTNGEEGENMMDWGVKHSSASFVDRGALDVEYRELLNEFDVKPERDVPDEGKVNILLLPYTRGRVLLGYMFPSTDHKGRKSSASVVCVVPDELTEERVREVARRIWSSNDLSEIARHGGTRPDTLEADESAKTEADYPFEVREWPGGDTGYFSADSKIRELTRAVVEEPAPEAAPEPEPKPEGGSHYGKWIMCAVIAIAVVGAGALGVSWYMDGQAKMRAAELQRIAEQERIAREAQERAEHEARIRAQQAEDDISPLERKLREAENYLADAFTAESAKQLASDVMRGIDALNVPESFLARVQALRSQAQRVIASAEDIVRRAEEARRLRAQEEARKREESERQRVSQAVNSMLATLQGIREVQGFQLESADNLPVSGNEIDTPVGKLRVRRLDDGYALLDVEAVKRALMSICSDAYKSDDPDNKYFEYRLTVSKPQVENVLRRLDTDAFMSIAPASLSNPLNVKDYLTREVSAGKQSFRLFYKSNDGNYVVVYLTQSSASVYLGTTGSTQFVIKKDFTRELSKSIEVDDNKHRISFTFKHDDERMQSSGIDGRIAIFIEQISGGAQ